VWGGGTEKLLWLRVLVVVIDDSNKQCSWSGRISGVQPINI
jgi:hypothetical protein